MNEGMKRIIILFVSLLSVLNIFAQNTVSYQSGATGMKNLQDIANLAPYTGAVGFDNRYEGVKGTTRLFDTLITSAILVRGQEKYIQLKSDIDVVNNTLVFMPSATGALREITSDTIAELIVYKDGKQLIYRTTRDIGFEKQIEGNKFYQVLKKGPDQFIKIPEKKFVEADYKRVYSPDIRYDEFKPVNKYFIEGSDSIFHRVQLNKKSLVKMFPDKKELIEKGLEGKSEGDAEIAVISILEQF